MDEIKQKIQDYQNRLTQLVKRLAIDKKRAELVKLNEQTISPGFWDDQEAARIVGKVIADYTSEITEITKFQNDLNSLTEMIGQPEAESLVSDFTIEADRLGKQLDRLEVLTYLSGKFDNAPAILAIHAGQGGTEAMDWAEMLQRMYVRVAERRGWSVDIVDITPGDEAGIKTVTMIITGRYAYGYLRGEKGTHRLVRQSPFNADKLRQTSFALVEVLPQVEDNEVAEIPDTDIEITFFRASSHGGQNVQKVSTAVRIKHLPTGFIVQSQSERYQDRNRDIALRLLKAKLWEFEEAKRFEEKKEMKGVHKIAGWGNQIRSYVLHPYKMVKDLRTNYETSDTTSVLDGDLDGFLETELKAIV